MAYPRNLIQRLFCCCAYTSDCDGGIHMIRVKFSGMDRHYFKRLWQGFWQLADPKIWIASTIPLLVAAALAYKHTGLVNVWWFVISLVAVYLIEIGKNA